MKALTLLVALVASSCGGTTRPAPSAAPVEVGAMQRALGAEDYYPDGTSALLVLRVARAFESSALQEGVRRISDQVPEPERWARALALAPRVESVHMLLASNGESLSRGPSVDGDEHLFLLEGSLTSDDVREYLAELGEFEEVSFNRRDAFRIDDTLVAALTDNVWAIGVEPLLREIGTRPRTTPLPPPAGHLLSRIADDPTASLQLSDAFLDAANQSEDIPPAQVGATAASLVLSDGLELRFLAQCDPALALDFAERTRNQLSQLTALGFGQGYLNAIQVEARGDLLVIDASMDAAMTSEFFGSLASLYAMYRALSTTALTPPVGTGATGTGTAPPPVPAP